jgi:uncharacterized protein YdhG (YjbR/CyaY superfamily)
VRRDSSSPQAYRADVKGAQRQLLDAIRDVVLEVAPEATEGIGHGMLDYTGLANLAAQKGYVALYVAPAVLARHKDDFPGVSAGKSCLRFRRIEQVDREALARLLRDVRAHRSRDAS